MAQENEEISWGQWFFGFETPGALKEINVKNEVTIHNIQGIHGRTEYARVAFGYGGIFGVWLASRERFRKTGAPRILIVFLVMISVHASFDLYNDVFGSIQKHFDNLISWFAEFVEMMIGMTAFFYMWPNAKMLSIKWKAKVSGQ